MTTMEGQIIMEDTDREWLKRELDSIGNRLDRLPCITNTSTLNDVKRGLKNHVEQHKERWSKTQIVVVVSLGILGILSWIPKITDIFSNISK